jgi:hypothetical protein
VLFGLIHVSVPESFHETFNTLHVECVERASLCARDGLPLERVALPLLARKWPAAWRSADVDAGALASGREKLGKGKTNTLRSCSFSGRSR